VGGFTINVDGHTVRQSITIGIAKLPANQDFNNVLNLCQRALDAARAAGESQIQIANDKFIRVLDAQGAFVTQRDVEDALENGEFNYVMQPIIDISTATIAGVDAKVNWQRATDDHLSFDAYRDHFLEIVMKQSHDDILAVLAQELIKSADMAKTSRVYWHTRSRLLENDAIMHRIAQGFGKHPAVSMALAFPAKSMLARTLRSPVVNNLHYLRDAGVTVVIDAANLDDINVFQIAQLPIDAIILSGSIIEDITSDRRMQDRVAPIVELLRKFDVKIAAANVKTQAQLQTAAGLGIRYCSGDIFAQAVPQISILRLPKRLKLKHLSPKRIISLLSEIPRDTDFLKQNVATKCQRLPKTSCLWGLSEPSNLYHLR
jgi:EAL domain-containing protein (putative c-di-GMP-specific phosphodiesterase class I)